VVSNINYKFTAMNKINYVVGDATRPIGDGIKIIPHICNDENRWGAGFVLALSKRWTYPEQFYRAMPEYPLGHVDILKVEDDIYVANMIAQHLIKPDANGNPPIRYDALQTALKHVNKVAGEMGATLHMPRIGTGYAGGKWEIIEAILQEFVTVDVTVYDLN
jgi:O-acetyl-ADP-ribose deacetylase (regulator of RNase III)